jgi:flagellar biosynthesis chaperone FliJ
MQEALTKFAIDMLNEVAEECENKSDTATGERRRALLRAAEKLPDIMSKIADTQEDTHDRHDQGSSSRRVT